MSTSPIYRIALLYEAVMLMLYRSGYFDRYRKLAGLIPDDSTVTDLCCGPATLYHCHLKRKGVRYTGLDINAHFVDDLSNRGGIGIHWNVTDDKPLPPAQYVVIQASLYHFLPDPRPIVDRMLAAASSAVIIAEPVRNMTDSGIPLIAALASRLTNPGTGEQPRRFNEAMLERFFAPYRNGNLLAENCLIAGGRERLVVLRPRG